MFALRPDVLVSPKRSSIRAGIRVQRHHGKIPKKKGIGQIIGDCQFQLAISKAHPAFHKVCQESPSEVLDNSSNEGLRALLQRFKDNNKVVFLCTNSPFTNLDGGMSYMLGSDWQQYFDLTIINAGKPGFFTNKRSGFREYSPKSDRLKWKPVTKFLPTKIYAGVRKAVIMVAIIPSGSKTFLFCRGRSLNCQP